MRRSTLQLAISAAILASGCSRTQAPAGTQATAGPAAAPATAAAPVQDGHGAIEGLSYTDRARAAWVAIKDIPYADKAQFASGAAGLESLLSAQVSDLNAHRASMTAGTKDWDFAMKEMLDSQQYLKAMIQEASQATPDTWEQEKDKVDQAWQRAQAAFERVKSTTTT